jgi:outer membrane biosynthesis protein TonB
MKYLVMKTSIFDSKCSSSRCALTFAIAAIMLFVFGPATIAEVLQGSIEEENLRLGRTQDNNSGQGQVPPTAPPLRMQRPSSGSAQAQKGLVDVSAFTPLTGNVQQQGANLQQQTANLGLMRPQEFGTIPNSKFDLGADRSSKELVLAWERWHHQLSEAIYRRWSEVAREPGEATMRITVTRDRNITAEFVNPSGNSRFDRKLMDTIESLNGNPGLTFPSGSQRQVVSLEADYVASTNIQPGFSWVKNDYEKVHQDY